MEYVTFQSVSRISQKDIKGFPLWFGFLQGMLHGMSLRLLRTVCRSWLLIGRGDITMGPSLEFSFGCVVGSVGYTLPRGRSRTERDVDDDNDEDDGEWWPIEVKELMDSHLSMPSKATTDCEGICLSHQYLGTSSEL